MGKKINQELRYMSIRLIQSYRKSVQRHADRFNNVPLGVIKNCAAAFYSGLMELTGRPGSSVLQQSSVEKTVKPSTLLLKVHLYWVYLLFLIS